MTKARKAARDQECTVRGPNCLWGTETVVLAHVRRPWNAGVGMKPKDSHGVYACANCHDFIDQRGSTPGRAAVDSYLVDALLRTRDEQEQV